MKEPYEDAGVNCIIESTIRLSISIPIINDSNSPKRLQANTCVAQLIPFPNDDDIYPLDIDALMSNVDSADNDNNGDETLECNAVKKKNPKPEFSRPICPQNEGESDEVIVRKSVKKYASHL